jgi:hypothetical protein
MLGLPMPVRRASDATDAAFWNSSAVPTLRLDCRGWPSGHEERRRLEQAGLVATEKVGRVRTCTLGPRRLEEETAWIERYRQLRLRFDELDKVVEEPKRKEGRWTQEKVRLPP